jgi:hypothetical protein
VSGPYPLRGAALPLLGVLALAGSGTPDASAQSTTGSITGTVRGLDGAPLAGATVLARSVETGAERAVISDREGRYRIDLLAPGRWIVTARPAEGPPGPARTAEVELQRTLSIDLGIAAPLTETVTVSAAAPVLDRERTGGELSIGQTAAADLPIAGRQLTDLALLDASVRPSAPTDFYGERGTVFIINGQSGRANSFLVDGLDNNDLTSNTTLNAPFSSQVIREFKVLTHQLAPEFGRAAGGVVNIITRQGTNDRTLDVFAQGVTHGLSHAGEFVESLPNPSGLEDTSGRFQAGFALGGPFRRDRSFYFLSYEHAETDAVTPHTGVGRDGIAGGIDDAPASDDNLFFRADLALGESSTLMLRASGDLRSAEGLRVGGRNTPEAGFSADEQDAQVVGALTSVLSPSLMNEARLLVGTSGFEQEANSSRPGVDRPSGVFGGNNLNRQERDEDRLQIVDNMTWQSGRHTWKFGVDVIRSHTEIATLFNPNGNFNYATDRPFEPGDCGDLNTSDVDPNHPDYPYQPIDCQGDPDGIDDDGDGVIDEPGVIGTYPVFFQLIDGAPTAVIRDTRLGLFGQDTWQAGRRWVLTYGLRYDLSTFHLPGSFSVPSSIPNGGAPVDRDNLAPRGAFTFTPDEARKWLVRGGAGVFYDKVVFSFPAVAAITSGTQIGLLFPQGLALEITEDLVEEVGIDVIKEGLLFPPELILRFSTDTTLETPYTVLYNLGIERSLGEGGSLFANATRSLGYHQTLTRDLNPVIGKTAQGVPVHVDDTVGSIAAFVSEGRTWYSGLDLGWRWRGRRGWLSFSYTVSKALDMGPDPLQGGFYLPPTTVLSREKGRSDNDRRHRAALAGSAVLPWGGIVTSWVLQASSGMPFNVTSGSDDNLDGFLTDRPAGVGRNTGASTSLAAINALRARPYLNLPPVTRLEEPRLVQLDLRIARPFPLGGNGHRGQAFLQAFNLFDRWNGGPIDGVATSRTFGEPIGQVGPPLTVEVGFALSF